jgi:hypothetical protein
MAPTFTVLTRNHALQSGRYVGTFATREEADAYVALEAGRSRSFVDFEVWLGTPRAAVKPLGPVVKGGC